MRKLLAVILTTAALATCGAADFTPIWLPGNWPAATWWTNAPPPTSIVASNAFHALNENFTRASNTFAGIIAGTGQTNMALLNGTNTFSGTNVFNVALIVSGALTATNGLYSYISQTNATLGFTNVWQPGGHFAFLSMYTTNTINGGTGTYAPITNFTSARTNLMTCDLANGSITNSVAGFYSVNVSLSAVAADNAATVEGDVLINGVERDDISFIGVYDNPARTRNMNASGILYLAANSAVTFQVKSTGVGGVVIWRAQLTVCNP